MTPEETWIRKINAQYQWLLNKSEEKQYKKTNFKNNISNLLWPWCQDASRITGLSPRHFMPEELRG